MSHPNQIRRSDGKGGYQVRYTGQELSAARPAEVENPYNAKTMRSIGLWFLLMTSFFAMFSGGWSSNPLVWIPMLLIGGWGAGRSLREFGRKRPGVFGRIAVDLVVGIIAAIVVHEVHERAVHHHHHD